MLNKLCLLCALGFILCSIYYWCSLHVLTSLEEFISTAYYFVIEFVIVLVFIPHQTGIRADGST